MIISASRRTDIPAFHIDWLLDRLKEGHVTVKNPFNPGQVRLVDLSPDSIECIVFWSKNPASLLKELKFLAQYPYYFQFTLNPYDSDIETNLPEKKVLIETFKKLSDTVGPERVIWRYDPVLLNPKYSVNYHIDKFHALSLELSGFTKKAVFSFLHHYRKILKQIKLLGITEIGNEEKQTLAENFSRAAREAGLIIESCATEPGLTEHGIAPGRCIDDRLIRQITGRDLSVKKDKNQRPGCLCVSSVDIGEYNTCSNACLYCYA